MNAGVLARQTPGFSGAELSNLVNEAALLAAKTSKPKLSADLLDSARDKAIMGVERKLAAMLLDGRYSKHQDTKSNLSQRARHKAKSMENTANIRMQSRRARHKAKSMENTANIFVS